jgi:hypothetical protein
MLPVPVAAGMLLVPVAAEVLLVPDLVAERPTMVDVGFWRLTNTLGVSSVDVFLVATYPITFSNVINPRT